jgi:hypothetical protein
LVSNKGYIGVLPLTLLAWKIAEEATKNIPSHVSHPNLKGEKMR